MRAKKTSIDLQTITKKVVNRTEALAQNTCKNLLRSHQFYRTQRDNKSNTPKTSTEACKQFTDKEEPLKLNKTYLLTIIFQIKPLRHTTRILKTFSQDTGYTNREPERCPLCTSELCEPKYEPKS